MKTLICGSLAYDTIMVFPDRFGRHILADQAHMLSVSFTVGEMRREWGGCAGNIAYNLRGLGGAPVVMATLGDDGGAYRDRLESLGIGLDGVRHVPGTYTAQAFIITDLDDNQITAFHPGAMSHSHRNRIAEASGVRLAIVSPDGRQGMVEHSRDLAQAKIPYVLDPGQGLPMFSGEDLLEMLSGARCLTVNDYEARLVEQKTGKSLAELSTRVEAVVVTRGAEGADIHFSGQQIHVPAVRPDSLVDPTGCGDAFRAGLLYGMARGWDWRRSARLASLMGSIKIAHRGGQNHRASREDVERRFQEAFGETL